MYIYGKNVAKEQLSTNNKIVRAYISKKFRDQNIIDLLKDKGVKINFVDELQLDRKVDGNHQGIVLEVDDVKTLSLDYYLNLTKDKENPLLVMLDHLEDPHNFGAIIRTCEAAGVTGIIIPKNRCVEVNATVIRTSVGASKYVPIVEVTNLTNTINELKKDGFWVVGTDMDGTNYTEIDYKGKTCLIIGNEGSGMSRIVRDNCDFIATIPMNGKINSLNASVAAGIVIYEAIKVRNEL